MQSGPLNDDIPGSSNLFKITLGDPGIPMFLQRKTRIRVALQLAKCPFVDDGVVSSIIK